MSDFTRADGRSASQIRPLRFQNHIAPHAAGSTLIEWGKTRVICAVMVEENVPRWMKEQKVEGGWLTAEYSMLPYSTLDRKPRDITKGRLDGRSSEIQRLIGRSMRAAVNLGKTGARTFCIDCDVLQADGGTRTAAITGTEDVAATVDMNLVMNSRGEFIELQGSGEEATFTDTQLAELLAVGKSGIRELLAAQQAAIAQG